MFTRPYSIYIDKRPIRIAFLVDPSPDSIKMVDQIIDYNRGLWGGRFNPIILTDGNTIDPKWWQFLRDVDPDIIRPLVPLSTDLIEKFEKFLSPLKIEKFQENNQSDLDIRVRTSIEPASIDANSLDVYKDLAIFGEPVLATFNVEEMDDEIARLFLLHNFGLSAGSGGHGSWDAFDIPILLETALSRGEVPPEVHEGFGKKGFPLSREAFSKKSIQIPQKWAIIDTENNRVHFVERRNGKLFVLPYRQSSEVSVGEIKKKICLVTNRRNLRASLLKLSHTGNIVYRDQICAFPNTGRELEKTSLDWFEVIVGDTLQDIVHFWNRPWLLSRSKRKLMKQLWLPTTLATDPIMEDALYEWIDRNTWKKSENPRTVNFVTFSTENRELEEIAGKFQEKLGAFTHVKHYTEPQIPSLTSEHLSFFLSENPLSPRDISIEVHRAQGNKELLELTEPNGFSQRYLSGYWMADFYIEFTNDMEENQSRLIRIFSTDSPFWKFPNRNHLTRSMFDKFSRIKQDGFPSALMRRGERLLNLRLENPESVVASLFYSNNRFAYEDSDPRVQVATAPYYSFDISDKGKYLQGVLELFGNLTFAYEVFRNPYWRAMFDLLSKNTRAEQGAQEFIANKLKKFIDRSEPLTSANQKAIEALAAQTTNLAKTLTLKQEYLPFDEFMQEAETWCNQFVENVRSTGNASERDLMGYGFRREDVKKTLSQLTQRNIIQIGVKPRCPGCGMAAWYHIDDIGQQLTCQGCRVPFPLHLELTWYYRLNSLVHAAYVSHGITPVILVLGQLLNKSKISFLFSPNLDLLAAPEDRLSEKLKTIAEVDIACIQDGKFIIGEVKQSISLFTEKDFDAMAEIAERVKPDIVLFSCVDRQQPTQSINNHIEKIRSKLSPLEIDVIWYELEALDYAYGV